MKSASSPRLLLALACALAAGCAHDGVKDLSPAERAKHYLSKNQPAQAIPLLEELHRKESTDLGVARALCEAQVKAGRTEAFIARLSAAIEAPGGDSAVNHYMLGLAYFARSADAGGPAVAELERAIALDPKESELHYRLGVALLESERFEAALPPLKKALE
ncbi:MAG: tetratricopeptide repeat protein, partial [Myxococcaceae bacterium]